MSGLRAPIGLMAMDVEGAIVEIGGRRSDRAVALVFLDVGCPIAQKSIPALNDVATTAKERSIDFYGVISDPYTTRVEAATFAREFAIQFPVLFDQSGAIAVALEPTRVPEAFLLDPAGGVLYRGRVNDAFADIGVARARVESHDFRDALVAFAAKQPIVHSVTTPVGCVFEAWKGGALPERPTFARDVMPIIETRCVECHRDGEAAPFVFDSFESVRKRTKSIRETVVRGIMPPWTARGMHGAFVDDPRLTEREKAVLLKWLDGEHVEGAAEDRPPPRKFATGWALGTPDLVLEMAEVMEIPASGPDQLRCFVMPTGLAHAADVVAIEYRPGDPKVVHHALFVTDVSGSARALDREDSGPGYARFGGVGFDPAALIGGYLPGTRPLVLPSGTAFRLDANADFVLQVHYHPIGKAVNDRGRIGLWFAKDRIDRHVLTATVFTQDIDIPPGVADYRRDAKLEIPTDVEIQVIAPHLHNVARSVEVRARTPDGRSLSLITIEDWDFRSQRLYVFKKPLRVPRGSTIELEAHYDNTAANPRNPSSPPQRVGYGDSPTTEMCMVVLGLTVDPRVEERIEKALATTRPTDRR